LFGSGKTAMTCDQVDIVRAAAFFGERMRVMMQLAPKLESELERLGNAELFRDLEMPLVPVLGEMELAGVSVDLPYLQQVSRELYEQLQRLDREIADVAHGPINVNSPQQLARFLFEDLNLPGGRKTKSGYSTDANVLEGLRDQHPVVPKILEFRQLSKLKGTYVDALPLLVDARTHRVHTSFNQTVAATGRLSSSDPNLQNIPIRTEVGQKVRRAFIPGRPGDILLSADYSQIELRVLAHMTDDPVLVDAFARGEDIHARTAAEVFAIPQAQVTANQRRLAKVVNFGLFYGLSDFGLARDTGMSTEEARVFIDAYFRAYNRVREFLEGIKMQAREQGYVETLLHRRRYIQDIRSPNRMLRQAAERIAINMPVQGSAADIMKLAMIRLQQYLGQQGLQSRMILTVHDELVIQDRLIRYPTARQFVQRLRGRTIASVARRGKYIVMPLLDAAKGQAAAQGEDGSPNGAGAQRLIVHLGMTGHLRLWEPEEMSVKHTHVRVLLDSGLELRYDDQRQFGRLLLGTEAEIIAARAFPARLGPEPIHGDLTEAEFAELIHARRRPVKSALLDQSFLAGVGNIYADEACFRAGI